MIGRALIAFVSGLLFAVGLTISKMTDPQTVLAFLDLAGAWEPSLALVMLGAIGSYGLLAPLALRRSRPLLASRFVLPRSERVDRRALVGAVIFGAGWGLAGYCPGPAIASLAGPGASVAAIALVTMAAGGLLADAWTACFTCPKGW